MSVNKVNQSTGELSPISGGTLYADAPIGSIQAYGGSSAPWGWLLCQGQAVSRATYAELFGVIGTSFGVGDGSTTFNVPDLRGEFLRGAGTNGHSGQGNGGSVGQHQDATQIPDAWAATSLYNISIYTTTDGSVIRNGDSVEDRGLYKTLSNSASSQASGYNYRTVRPTNTSVNFIIKATTIALPSDFASAVDEKIAANIVDSITDGNMKAATSNAVFDALNAAATWTTVDTDWKRTKFKNGLIFAYRGISLTCGTVKGTLHPNSYYSQTNYSITNLGFTKALMGYADVYNSYTMHLGVNVGISYDLKTCTCTFFSDQSTGTWEGRLVLIGF